MERSVPKSIKVGKDDEISITKSVISGSPATKGTHITKLAK